MSVRSVLGAAFLFLISCVPAAFAQTWTATSLGSLDGDATANGANNAGVVVGESYTPAGATHAFRWVNGVLTDLGTLPGFGLYSTALDVNDAGWIVGASDTGTTMTVTHAARWTPAGVIQDLGTLGGPYSFAHGINSAGQVVGGADLANGAMRAFILSPGGSMTSLGTLGGLNSEAFGISDAGHVVGRAQAADGNFFPFIWTAAGGMAALPNPPGLDLCTPRAVNNSGQAVGTCDSPMFRAVIWSGGTAADLARLPLDTYSTAGGINSRGEIAGSSGDQAVVWRPAAPAVGGAMEVAPNPILALPSLGGSFSFANGINDAGLVVGGSALPDDVAYPAASWSAPWQDVAIDFGATYGTWKLGGLSVWQAIHSFSPESLNADELVANGSMVTGDLDGNGLDDLVIDFGAPYGVWRWMNHATWTQLHGLSPTKMLTADLDGNGRDEVILEFPGLGLWRFNNNATWAPLHGLGAAHLASANLDGTGGEELLINFAGAGLWRFHHTTGWTLIHGFDVSRIVTGDLDGNGQDEVVVQFGALGLWAFRNNTTWTALHGFGAAQLAAGDLDGNGQDELVVDFGAGLGLYILANNTTWGLLHPLSAEALAVGDLDGGGREDVVIDFGAPGLWLFKNNGTWQQLHTLSPEAITLGRLH